MPGPRSLSESRLRVSKPRWPGSAHLRRGVTVCLLALWILLPTTRHGAAETLPTPADHGISEVDHGHLRGLAAREGMVGVMGHIAELPPQHAALLARRLVRDHEPNMALAGAAYLAHWGVIGPAIPVLSDAVARRADGVALLSRIIYGMQAGGSEAMVDPLRDGIQLYFRVNRARYTAAERSRFETAFGAPGGARKGPPDPESVFGKIAE